MISIGRKRKSTGHKEYSMLDKIGSYGDSFTGGILIEANASLLEKLVEVLDIHRMKRKPTGHKEYSMLDKLIPIEAGGCQRDIFHQG